MVKSVQQLVPSYLFIRCLVPFPVSAAASRWFRQKHNVLSQQTEPTGVGTRGKRSRGEWMEVEELLRPHHTSLQPLRQF